MKTSIVTSEFKDTAYLLVYNGVVEEAGHAFMELTGYSGDDVFQKNISEIIAKLLRMNCSVNDLENNRTDIDLFFFTKHDEAREVIISINQLENAEEQIYIFTEKPDSRLNEKIHFVNQIFLDNVIGAAVYSVPDLILLKANQEYISFLDTPNNYLGKITGGSHSIEVYWDDLLKTHKTNYFKELKCEKPEGGISYWDIAQMPIFEDGKMKYIYITASNVTESVLERKQKDKSSEEIIKSQNTQLERQNIILNAINNIYETAVGSDNFEEFGQACLDIIRSITKSKFGFISEMGSDGYLYDIVFNNPGYEHSRAYDKSGHRHIPASFILNGLFGRVLLDGKSIITNDPSSHPDSISLPEGHPHLTAFLGVPFIYNGEVAGMIGVYNREGGYQSEDQIILEALTPTIFQTIMHKRSEEELKKSGERFRNLVKNAPTFIYEVDFKVARFLSVNELMCKVSGYTNEEFLSMSPFDILDDNSKVVFQTRINQCLKGDKPEDNAEYKVKAKDGRLRDVVINAYFRVGEYGIINEAIVVGHDITERKKFEQELIEAKRVAEQNKLILETVIKQMPAGVIITNASGSQAQNNEEMDRIWRRNMLPEENIDNHEYIAYHPDGREYHPDEWPLSRALMKDEVIFGEEMTILRGDGTKGIVLVNSAPIKDESGAIIAGIVIDVDITELRQAEEELRTKNERLFTAEMAEKQALKKAMEMKDEFLSLISHEFRTPITVINSAVQALEFICKDELSQKAKGFINKIRQNSLRQLRLVNNLLDITRINAGHIRMKKENHDIVFHTKMIVESVNLYSHQKGINLSFSSTLKEKIIGLDEEKYERILLNLLSNAIKFTSSGKGILVSVSFRKGFVCIKVKDEGLGIPKGKLGLIFERFGQVDSSLSRQAEGSGIGLSLVKMFVEEMGGLISVRSKVGKGSIFTILLPDLKVQENKNEKILMELSDNRLIQCTAIEFSDIYLV